MDRKFAKSHEWAAIEGSIATVGISDYAQQALGDIVFVQLPEVGTEITAGESFAEVESVKAVSEIYAPVSGKIIEVNSEVQDNAASVNADAYAAWFVKVEMTAEGDLMSEAEYNAMDKE